LLSHALAAVGHRLGHAAQLESELLCVELSGPLISLQIVPNSVEPQNAFLLNPVPLRPEHLLFPLPVLVIIRLLCRFESLDFLLFQFKLMGLNNRLKLLIIYFVFLLLLFED
jgi:hypothetical protein